MRTSKSRHVCHIQHTAAYAQGERSLASLRFSTLSHPPYGYPAEPPIQGELLRLSVRCLLKRLDMENGKLCFMATQHYASCIMCIMWCVHHGHSHHASCILCIRGHVHHAPLTSSTVHEVHHVLCASCPLTSSIMHEVRNVSCASCPLASCLVCTKPTHVMHHA